MNKKVMILLLILFLFMGGMPVHALEKKDRIWEDESVYRIVIDRFNDANLENNKNVDVTKQGKFNGGDFAGIQKKLDYIKDMGFTVISLSPIFETEKDRFNDYSIEDFYKTEQHYGSLQEFKQLVKEAHKKKLKVMIEMPTLSVGRNHPWTKDPGKADWFVKDPKAIGEDGSLVQASWIDGLPRLNQEKPEVHSYLVNVAKWWIKKSDIDGFYIPFVEEVPASLWKDFNQEMKKTKKNMYVVGMDASGDMAKAASYQQAGFDGMINVSSVNAIRKAFASSDNRLKSPLQEVQVAQKLFKQPRLNENLIDELFTTRFTQDIVQSKRNPATAWNLALTYLYTIPGIPSILYGSEIAVNGGRYPDNAQFMGFKADKEIIDHLTKIGKLRQELPALTRGTFSVLYNQDGLAVYKRSYKNEVIVVVVNNSSKTKRVTLTSEQLAKKKELRGLLAGDLAREKNGKYHIVIEREKSEVYALTDKTGINMGFIGAIIAVWVAFAIFIFFVMKRSKRNQ
ncbi:alpha-amylase family glycosyl hydrolase [Bacillus testis]|uniref:alpha-amylase family glycosyl hydrolase n=1 Tax=Bacillus testis TaxID=1622072 RepID=UPI00067E679C|nr:alpha-amylase family glycosyl hydrolase [Bacillus testis]